MKKFLFVLFFGLMGLAGCSEDTIDPVIGIPEGRKLAVVPFRDELFENGFESPRGRELAADVTKCLRNEVDFTIVSQNKVLDLWDEKKDPRSPTAREVAKALACDYVLMAHVVHWSVRDDYMLKGNLLRGSAEIEVSIYETGDAAKERVKSDKERDELPPNGLGHLAVAQKRVSAVFPREYGMANIGTYDMTEQQVEDGLKLAAGQAVAWLLIEHKKEDETRSKGK